MLPRADFIVGLFGVIRWRLMRMGLVLVATASCNWFHGLEATEQQPRDPFPRR